MLLLQVTMLISFLFREEAVLKLRTTLRMHLRRFMGLGFTSKQFMKERSIHAGNASTRQLQMEVLLNTSVQYMKERSIHAGNVTTRQLQREVLLNTSVQFMKERNTHAGNATTRQLQRVILINTSVQYMKERSIHAGNVTTRQLQREVLLNTSVQFIYKLIHVEQYRRIRSWPVMRGILSLFFNVQNVKMCLPLLEPIKASRILT